MFGGIDGVLFDISDDLLPVFAGTLHITDLLIVFGFLSLDWIFVVLLDFAACSLDQLWAMRYFDSFVHIAYILIVFLEQHLIRSAVLSRVQKVILRLDYLALNPQQLLSRLRINRC